MDVIRRVVVAVALLATIGCAADKAVVVPFEHLDECNNPTRESMAWGLIQGRVIEVISARTFRLRTDAGTIVNVSLPNVGEPFDPEAVASLRKMIGGKRVSVMPNSSTIDQKDIVGDVEEQRAGYISRQLLRTGAAAFAKEPSYTLSDYSECLNRIAEREAKAKGVGIWHWQISR